MHWKMCHIRIGSEDVRYCIVSCEEGLVRQPSMMDVNRSYFLLSRLARICNIQLTTMKTANAPSQYSGAARKPHPRTRIASPSLA